MGWEWSSLVQDPRSPCYCEQRRYFFPFQWYFISNLPRLDTQLIVYFSSGLKKVEFDLPSSLPSGQYLVRIENIALHNAAAFGQGTHPF
jgi:Auxiliary Activity family 9 (formerly GH61)